MKKLIKMYNEKYGDILGVIDDDFNKEQMYRIYYFIKNNCDDKDIQNRIKMINLDKPKTLEQQLTKLEGENGNSNDSNIKKYVDDNTPIKSFPVNPTTKTGAVVVINNITSSGCYALPKRTDGKYWTNLILRVMPSDGSGKGKAIMLNGYQNYVFHVNIDTKKIYCDNLRIVYSIGASDDTTDINTEPYFLPTTNTKEYTPTENYHPATKKYVDDKIKTDLGDEELTTVNKDVKGAINEVNAQYKDIVKENNVISNLGIIVETSEELKQAIKNKAKKIWLSQNDNEYVIDESLILTTELEGNNQSVRVKTPIIIKEDAIIKNVNFYGDNKSTDCLKLCGGNLIQSNKFYSFKTAIKQEDTCVHCIIKNNTIGYCLNGTIFDNQNEYSVNNMVYEENYHVKNGIDVDDLTANGTESEDNYIGCGLILYCGCNNISIRKNVFEYNSFCGILIDLARSNTKTFDGLIEQNYFEGNKIYSFLIKGGSVTTNQLKISYNFYSNITPKNSDFKNTNIILKNSPFSYYPIMDNTNTPALLLGGNNVEYDYKKNCISIGKLSQYIALCFDHYKPYDTKVKVKFVYKANLKSLINLCDGNDTNVNIYAFDSTNGVEKSGTDILEMPNNINKYLSRLLQDDEYIEIYKYYIID